MVTLQMIQEAQESLKGIARKTPLENANRLGENIYIKSENLQLTGAFKIRGAYNKIRSLTPEEASHGVIACSAGNHAQGIALSATKLGIKSVICMPEGAPISKVEATRNYGAEVVLVPGVYDDAAREAERLSKEHGYIMKKVLVLEDEANIRSFVVINLKRAGYDAIEAGTGQEALDRLKEHPDTGVAILDIMLPDMDGFEVCRNIRATNKQIGIIMLTAREEEMDKVFGLETGADDYMTKPFSMKELMARVKANIRRRSMEYASAQASGTANTVEANGLCLNPETYQVTKNGAPVDLTQKEYDLLSYLIRERGKVFSREDLMQRVWNYDYYGDMRTVDVTVRRLREKIEDDPGKPQYILTRRGVGYYFAG